MNIKLKFTNKKILKYINICNSIGLLFCLFSFLFTYYYFEIFEKTLLNLALFLFEAGLSIIVGGIISSIIINKQIEK